MSPWMNASGDILNKISSGDKVKGPVIMWFDTTVYSFLISSEARRCRGSQVLQTLTAARITPSIVKRNPIGVK